MAFLHLCDHNIRKEISYKNSKMVTGVRVGSEILCRYSLLLIHQQHQGFYKINQER